MSRRIDIGSICHLIRAGQVPALSVQQPWAYRIIKRGKDIENRSWDHRYRGWVMLHAGKKIDRDALGDCFALPGDSDIDWPTGGIVGIVRIAGSTRDDPSRWFFGPVGFILRDPVAIPLIECRGQLGFFKPGPEIGDRVIEALMAKARPR